MKRVRAAAMLAAAVLLGAGGAGCKRSHASTVDEAREAPVVKDDTTGLLLTWIDDKGEFHVEARVADVPIMGRDAVRVVDPVKGDGPSPDRVYVADLRRTRADGTYAVHTMSRADFEAIAVARREKLGPTLAGGGTAQGSPGASAEAPATGPAARTVVTIYGASWCSACRDAMRYLRRKGIPYVEKDVEKDPAAAREMQQKLARNGLRAGSIPIIDVRGKVMVGFDPAAIDAALGEPL